MINLQENDSNIHERRGEGKQRYFNENTCQCRASFTGERKLQVLEMTELGMNQILSEWNGNLTGQVEVTGSTYGETSICFQYA